MKKLLSLLLSACILLSMTGFAAAAGYKAGAYTASAHGFGGDVTVTITFSGSAMTDVRCSADSETPSIGGATAALLAEKILAAQSADVDGIAGATFTSNAVLTAAKACVEQAASGAGSTGLNLSGLNLSGLLGGDNGSSGQTGSESSQGGNGLSGLNLSGVDVSGLLGGSSNASGQTGSQSSQSGNGLSGLNLSGVDVPGLLGGSSNASGQTGSQSSQGGNGLSGLNLSGVDVSGLLGGSNSASGQTGSQSSQSSSGLSGLNLSGVDVSGLLGGSNGTSGQTNNENSKGNTSVSGKKAPVGFNVDAFRGINNVTVEAGQDDPNVIFADMDSVADCFFDPENSDNYYCGFYPSVRVNSSGVGVLRFFVDYYDRNVADIQRIIITIDGKKYTFSNVAINKSKAEKGDNLEELWICVSTDTVPFLNAFRAHADELITVRLQGGSYNVDFNMSASMKEWFVRYINCYEQAGGLNDNNLSRVNNSTPMQVK